ncbi:MAG: hypothetical protein PHI19_00160 [Clostridia bacterium]|jgi:hypothetical protein|nr:hypothetical protein [Clostridia bacterium]
MNIGEVYAAGVSYPSFATQTDGYRLEFTDDGGFVLYCFVDGITDFEAKEFEGGKSVSVRYTVINDISYWCFKFGVLPWGDCPFSPSLYLDAGRPVSFDDVLPDGVGYSVTILLIESSTGTVRYIRMIGLGHEFSVSFQAWASGAAKEPLGGKIEYNTRINDVYNVYDVNELAKRGRANGFILEGSDT